MKEEIFKNDLHRKFRRVDTLIGHLLKESNNKTYRVNKEMLEEIHQTLAYLSGSIDKLYKAISISLNNGSKN